MSRADVSDPEILKKINEIKNSNSINWVLVGYVPKSDTKLKVADSGDGGLNELVSNLSDGKSLFGFLAMTVTNVKKFVYVAWCGEGVIGMKKGLFANHSNDVANGPFRGFHVQINARTEDDLDEKIVMDRLKKATGASYDSGQKNQGGAKLVPTNVAQGRQQAAQSNAKVKVADKSDYDKKNESASYWQQTNEPAVAEKPKPSARASMAVGSGNSSNLKSRFEDAARQQSQPPPPRAAPAPGRIAPGRVAPQGNAPKPPGPSNPPPGRAPPPASSKPPQHYAPPPPEPEPEPEPAYEEPAQTYDDQSYQDQSYQDQSYQQEDQSYQDQSYQDQSQEQSYDDQSYQQEAPQESYDQQESYGGDQGGYSEGGQGQVKALYDFDAENETDLSFREGDIINILDRTDPSGWYKGELNGVEGYFPSNFVEDC